MASNPVLVYDRDFSAPQNNPELRNLLLLVEISRRHAFDPIRKNEANYDGRDEFKNLPVGLGVAMIFRLKLAYKTFWPKDSKYHLFSGNGVQRKKAFTALGQAYMKKYLQGASDPEKEHHFQELMCTFFNPCGRDAKGNLIVQYPDEVFVHPGFFEDDGLETFAQRCANVS